MGKNLKDSKKAVLEGIVLQQVIEHFYQFKQRLEKEHTDNEEATSFDEGLLLMLLYGLIVLPWEVLRKKLQKDKSFKKKLLREWCSFELLQLAPNMQRKPVRLYFFMYLMRNALSHATIVVEDGSITFLDRNSTKIRLKVGALFKFLQSWVNYLEKLLISLEQP